MNILESKYYINQVLLSVKNKKELTPENIIELAKKSSNISIGTEAPVTGIPKMGYIKSNLKSVYYVIYCDSCNAKCLKTYPTVVNYHNDRKLLFLCNKCVGRKYARKKQYEKKSLDYFLHPEKLRNIEYNKLPLREVMAIMEAGYIEESIKKRAYTTASKYIES